MDNTEITRVTVRWDDQSGGESGWYVQTFAGREFVDDSQKVWFPIAVDDFGRDEENELLETLAGEFPGAEIEVK